MAFRTFYNKSTSLPPCRLLLLLLSFPAGFGKAFMNAGNKQWGVGYMQHDLSDAVAWAVAKGIADPNKVCIMGGSYGQ